MFLTWKEQGSLNYRIFTYAWQMKEKHRQFSWGSFYNIPFILPVAGNTFQNFTKHVANEKKKNLFGFTMESCTVSQAL